MTMVAVKEYIVNKRGMKNIVVSLPPVWIRRNDLKAGDRIEFLQSPDSDDLVIRKADNSTSGQTTARDSN